MSPIQLVFLLFIICRMFLSSLTLCNTSSVFSQSNYLFHPSPAPRFKTFEILIPNATFQFKCELYVDGPRPENCFIISVCVCEHEWNCGEGEKKLIVIDKTYKSCCFKNAEQLPIGYAMNNKEWMPSNIFNSMWNELWREKRKILLLVSNYPAYPCKQNSTKVKTFFASKHNFCFAASRQLHN